MYLSFSSAVRSNLSPSKATFMISKNNNVKDTTDPRFKFFVEVNCYTATNVGDP